MSFIHICMALAVILCAYVFSKFIKQDRQIALSVTERMVADFPRELADAETACGSAVADKAVASELMNARRFYAFAKTDLSFDDQRGARENLKCAWGALYRAKQISSCVVPK